MWRLSDRQLHRPKNITSRTHRSRNWARRCENLTAGRSETPTFVRPSLARMTYTKDSAILGRPVIGPPRRAFDTLAYESPDCLSSRWQIRLLSAPVIDCTEEFLRDAHLELTIIFQGHANLFTPCIDMPQVGMYVHDVGPTRCYEHPASPNPSQWSAPWPRLAPT